MYAGARGNLASFLCEFDSHRFQSDLIEGRATRLADGNRLETDRAEIRLAGSTPAPSADRRCSWCSGSTRPCDGHGAGSTPAEHICQAACGVALAQHRASATPQAADCPWSVVDARDRAKVVGQVQL